MSGCESKFTLRTRSFTDKLMRFDAIGSASCRLQGRIDKMTVGSSGNVIIRSGSVKKLVIALITLAIQVTPCISVTATDSIIRAKAGPSDIVITTTQRLAGAIHSLKWNGKEFIDSHDHGRQLQSAANFDLGKKFIPEVFNPTEAGSRADATGNRSSSKLLHLAAKGNELLTTIQMAFWLKPGEKSLGTLPTTTGFFPTICSPRKCASAKRPCPTRLNTK